MTTVNAVSSYLRCFKNNKNHLHQGPQGFQDKAFWVHHLNHSVTVLTDLLHSIFCIKQQPCMHRSPHRQSPLIFQPITSATRPHNPKTSVSTQLQNEIIQNDFISFGWVDKESLTHAGPPKKWLMWSWSDTKTWICELISVGGSTNSNSEKSEPIAP